MVLTRLGHAGGQLDLAMFAREQVRCTLAFVLIVLSLANAVVQTGIRGARIETFFAVRRSIRWWTLTSETIQLGETCSVMVTGLTGTQIDVSQAIGSCQAWWAVTAIVRCIRPETGASIATRAWRCRTIQSMAMIRRAWNDA